MLRDRPGRDLAERVAGLHHVTAIASSAQATTDFWVRVLGLSLVKRTVNFDDRSAHHLYFGDASGSPGTLVTYFAGSRLGSDGNGRGQATSIALRVQRTLRLKQRLARLGAVRLARDVSAIARSRSTIRTASGSSWSNPTRTPRDVGRQGHAVTLTVTSAERTLALLRAFGFTLRHEGAIARASGEAEVNARGQPLRAAAAGGDPSRRVPRGRR